MRRLILSIFCLTLCAQESGRRFALELEGEPLAASLGESAPSSAIHFQTVVAAHRAALRWHQREVARAAESAGARVRDRLELTANALIIDADPEALPALAALPGVVRVHRLQRASPDLDRSAVLLNATAAWARIGGSDRAGAGVKVAVLDTGVDQTIPALQDQTLPMPDGFPRANRAADLSYTSNKVIVARTYGYLDPTAQDNRPGADFESHGTETSSCVAAVTTVAPLGTISGIAPRAYIGNYKVLYADSGVDDAVLRGYEDAVADGMDVISMSFHTGVLVTRQSDALMPAMVQRAAELGVLSVRSTGNEGPLPATITDPVLGPFGILVGNSGTDRIFAGSLTFNGNTYKAVPGDGTNSATPIIGRVYDVGKLDGDGLACLALPPASLKSYIALIQRGTCNFSVKLANAAAAGAIAAIVYTDGREITTMATAGETLPAVMLERADGLAVQQAAAQSPNLSGTMDFGLHPFPANPRVINGSSSRGPGPENEILPDVVAVGTQVYMPLPGGAYGAASGTSFSAPEVAGAVALVKAARPGLSVPVYRSLLINTATPFALSDGTRTGVMSSGAGIINVDAALRSTLAAFPSSLTLGTGSGSVATSRLVYLRHLGAQADTWQVIVEPHDSAKAAPTVSSSSLTLAPGQAARITLTLSAQFLAPGEYEGFVLFRSASGAPDVRVPYWYGSTSNKAEIMSIPFSETSGTAGRSITWAFAVRLTDNYGIRQPSIKPTVTVQSGGGSVVDVIDADSLYPGVWRVDVRLGAQKGNNVFRVEAQGLSNTVTIVGL